MIEILIEELLLKESTKDKVGKIKIRLSLMIFSYIKI